MLRMKRAASKSIAMDIDLDVIKTFDQGTAPNLTLLVGNALQWLKLQKFTSSTFIYIDPPYLMTTRRGRRKIYASELCEDDHIRLLKTIQTLPCMVMISGYTSELYDDALSSWCTDYFRTTNRRGTRTIERLWMNYPKPTRLHDYRYLGNNFRERERIKRKKNRWIRKLLTMPDPERYALAAAIDEVDALGQHHHKDRSAPAHQTTTSCVPGGLQDHNILCPRDPIAEDNGTRSP